MIEKKSPLTIITLVFAMQILSSTKAELWICYANYKKNSVSLHMIQSIAKYFRVEKGPSVC